MYGLEQIARHNGWAISFLGITIVFSGLVSLSLILSQLYKVLEHWDNRKTLIKNLKKLFANPDTPVTALTKESLPANIEESTGHYKLLTNMLGDPFSLPKLIEFAENRGLAHPHSTVNKFLQQKIIVPDLNGFFTWSQ